MELVPWSPARAPDRQKYSLHNSSRFDGRTRLSLAFLQRFDYFGYQGHQLFRILLGRGRLVEVLPIPVPILMHDVPPPM